MLMKNNYTKPLTHFSFCTSIFNEHVSLGFLDIYLNKLFKLSISLTSFSLSN